MAQPLVGTELAVHCGSSLPSRLKQKRKKVSPTPIELPFSPFYFEAVVCASYPRLAQSIAAKVLLASSFPKKQVAPVS
jgi:hypothetical protein